MKDDKAAEDLFGKKTGDEFAGKLSREELASLVVLQRKEILTLQMLVDNTKAQFCSQTELFELQKLRNENKLLNERLSKQAEELTGLRCLRTEQYQESCDWAQKATDFEQELEEVDKALTLLLGRVSK